LSRHYVVPHISTGDMLRGAVRSRSEAGLQAKAYMDAGELIPDSVVIDLVGERLAHADTNRGFILDGFPRTVPQAEALADLLAPRGLDAVIDLEVETEVVLMRLASRRVCTDCGANYSTTQPPKVDWVCDICGGEVVQREDDTEAAIRRRLELYERETAPLVAWYAEQGILFAVEGEGQPDEVAARLVRVVDQCRLRSLEIARQLASGLGAVVAAVEGDSSPTPAAPAATAAPTPAAQAAPTPAAQVAAAESAAGTGSARRAPSGNGSEESKPAWF
jgi:adenylate kinase